MVLDCVSHDPEPDLDEVAALSLDLNFILVLVSVKESVALLAYPMLVLWSPLSTTASYLLSSNFQAYLSQVILSGWQSDLVADRALISRVGYTRYISLVCLDWTLCFVQCCLCFAFAFSKIAGNSNSLKAAYTVCT